MPSIKDHHSAFVTKLLLIGDSGTGKTGALASLARAGYNLWIADFDNGTDILAHLLTDDDAASGRVNYIPFQDEFFELPGTGNLVPISATAWPAFVGSLSKWEGRGSVEKWGGKDILIIDSLNFAGKAALRHIQQLNSRLRNPPRWQDYYEAQRLVENLCAKLYSASIKCNVICLSHIREIGKQQDVTDDKGRVQTIELADTVKGYPETGTGRALSPTIGRYFNAVLMADIQGTGMATKRIIRTVPWGNVGLKNSAPKQVKDQYPIETGLADYFAAVRGPAATPDKVVSLSKISPSLKP